MEDQRLFIFEVYTSRRKCMTSSSLRISCVYLQSAAKLFWQFLKKRCFEVPWAPTPSPLTLLGRFRVTTNIVASGITLNRGGGRCTIERYFTPVLIRTNKTCLWDVFISEVSQLILSPIVWEYKKGFIPPMIAGWIGKVGQYYRIGPRFLTGRVYISRLAIVVLKKR